MIELLTVPKINEILLRDGELIGGVASAEGKPVIYLYDSVVLAFEDFHRIERAWENMQKERLQASIREISDH